MKKLYYIKSADATSEYVIIWKYTVHPENILDFEKTYGSKGVWAKLFSQSKNYRGSILYKSEDVQHCYFLIDNWTDRQSYEDFKNTHAEVYTEMSNSYASLYTTEEQIGTYTKIL